MNHRSARGDRRLPRAALVVAAILLCTALAIATVYLVAPTVALSRGLDCEVYDDATGLDWGLSELEDRVRNNPRGAAGAMSPIAVDPLRRFVVFSPQWRSDSGNPQARYAAWGVLDTTDERIIASMRMPKASDSFFGFALRSHGDDFGPLVSESGILTWDITCQADVPTWWPTAYSQWPGGTTTQTIHISFDPWQRAWHHHASKPPDSDALMLRRWKNNTLNQPQRIPGSEHELIAEHEGSEGEWVFRRLARRNATDGSILWEVRPDQFPNDTLLDGAHRILLPPVGIESYADWCVLVHDCVKDRVLQKPRLWKLDLCDGRLTAIEPPADRARYFEVCSDGQTVLYWDDAFESQPSASASTLRARFGRQSDLVAWRPDREPQSVYEDTESHWFLVLPGGRVLLVAGTANVRRLVTGVSLTIVSLDGRPPRQIYP